MNIRTGAKTKVALLALALALILPTAAHGQTQAGQPQTTETVSLPEVKTSVIVSQNGESKALILKGGDKYEVKWQNSLENEYLSNVVTDEQGIMYVTGADGFLYRLDQEGKLLGKSDLWMYWAHYLEMGRDGLLYVIWDNTLEYEWEAPGYVIVVDKTGKELRAIEFHICSAAATGISMWPVTARSFCSPIKASRQWTRKETYAGATKKF